METYLLKLIPIKYRNDKQLVIASPFKKSRYLSNFRKSIYKICKKFNKEYSLDSIDSDEKRIAKCIGREGDLSPIIKSIDYLNNYEIYEIVKFAINYMPDLFSKKEAAELSQKVSKVNKIYDLYKFAILSSRKNNKENIISDINLINNSLLDYYRRLI